MVLNKMKETAEAYLGHDVKDAVVTVPAVSYARQLNAFGDFKQVPARTNLDQMFNTFLWVEVRFYWLVMQVLN